MEPLVMSTSVSGSTPRPISPPMRSATAAQSSGRPRDGASRLRRISRTTASAAWGDGGRSAYGISGRTSTPRPQAAFTWVASSRDPTGGMAPM